MFTEGAQAEGHPFQKDNIFPTSCLTDTDFEGDEYACL
jgi:hypothetical protein